MIRKIELLSYIESVSDDVNNLYKRMVDLEQKNTKLEKKVKKLSTSIPKKEGKLDKAIASKKLAAKAKKQPRDKNGKFAKK